MLTICDRTVRVIDGLYCLNDLHKASGGEEKHAPFRFMRNAETRSLAKQIERTPNMVDGSITKAYKVVRGGNSKNRQGTYVCKELVYRYAMWINPRFYLMVIRTFDKVANQQQELSKRLDMLCRNLNTVTTNLSQAGRFLNIGGKQTKPQLLQSIDSTLKQMQPSLNFEEAIDDD